MTAVESRGVALVTGGAVRVGRAISAALARAGFDVVVNYRRSAAAAEALVAELRGENHSAAARQADVTDPGAAAELFEFAAARGRLALLVNNAAVFERRAWLDVDSEHWNRHLRLNLEAPFRLSQMASRIMWQTGGGRIVNICGTVGIEPRGEYAAYCVAKAGLDTLTRCSAAALAPRVQVNGVAPGAILFPEGTPKEEQQRVLERVPAGRVGSPEDVAAAVLFFADAPDYVTGTILPVDGGASVHDG